MDFTNKFASASIPHDSFVSASSPHDSFASASIPHDNFVSASSLPATVDKTDVCH